MENKAYLVQVSTIIGLMTRAYALAEINYALVEGGLFPEDEALPSALNMNAKKGAKPTKEQLKLVELLLEELANPIKRKDGTYYFRET